MSLFKHNNHLTTCTQSVIKLILAVILIALLINRSHFLGHIDNKVINELINLLSGVIAVACIYTMYLSAADIFTVFENREKEILKNSDVTYTVSKSFSFDKIIEILDNEDIIEFVIKVDSSAIRIGASSDYNNTNGKFFDKGYFIEETEYQDITDFKTALSKVNKKSDTIEVISIDDLNPKYYNF